MGADAVFRAWEFNPLLLVQTLIIGFVYSRGWRKLNRQAPHRFGPGQLISFYAGLTTILLALLSPIDAFAGWFLTVHMVQHLMLMMVAPPLLLYGAPYIPVLFGLPRDFLKEGIGPLLASTTLRRVGRKLAHPVFCWSAFVLSSIGWHTPWMYELALRSSIWHTVEHLCFLATALLFWWPIVRPFPWTFPVSRWTMIPYLFLADFQNTALSAFLMFYERVLYPTYATAPRLTAMTALEDQAAAGAIMWVTSSIFFLIPVGLITIEVLSKKRAQITDQRSLARQLQLRGRETQTVDPWTLALENPSELGDEGSLVRP